MQHSYLEESPCKVVVVTRWMRVTIVVDLISPITVTDITHDLARESGKAWMTCCKSQDTEAATRCT